MKILFFGDVVGKPGRKAVKKILPKLKDQYDPDFVILNAENLAHGRGITEKTVNEMIEAGVNAFTSGNHIFQRKEGIPILEKKETTVLRPANYPPNVPGAGWKIFEVRTKKLLLINLIGRVFFREDYDCPFRTADEILAKAEQEKPNAIIVDIHTEASSESKALGFYLDGKASAVIGTHTHIPTSDTQILPQKTAYVTDVGMVGIKDSVLGIEKETVIERFLTQLPFRFDIVERGTCEVNAVIMDIDLKGKAKKIEKIYEEVEV
jgi:hypothetical protein